jgi:hypothetical protein
MRRWLTISAVMGALLLGSAPTWAQDDRNDDDDHNDAYNWALAVGVGLVEPANETEMYLMAALRMRVGRYDDEDGHGGGRGDKSIQGYLEPEIGYWESSDDRIEGSDLLVGVNLVGAFPFASAETFLGVGIGVHFLDAALASGDPRDDGSETKLGANAQFGLDLHLTRSLSAFGAGRFDLVQDAADEVQSKVYLGLRARF